MYYKLKLKKIPDLKQKVTENIIIEALQESFKLAFSTFPYIFEGCNSMNSFELFNSGDCVSLSLFLKKYLLDRYNIISFLIPATIPNKYKHNGYLNISHVSLAVPINNGKFYIADPAFYFLNPIVLNKKNNSLNKIVFSKNIYKYESSTELKDYISIDKIINTTKITPFDLKFNDYQMIPKNTYYSECYYEDDIFDKWKYFLIEILNPDEAITTFFINIRKNNPFITTCFMDNNGICKKRYYISFKNDSIKIQEYAKDTIFVKYDDITKEQIDYLENKLKRYFKGNFKKYLKMYYLDKIHDKEYKITLQDGYLIDY